MAATEWSSTSIPITGSDVLSMARGLVSKLSDLMGLTLADEYVNASDEKYDIYHYYWYYAFPSMPNLGLLLYLHRQGNDNTSCYFNIYTAYKQGDTWKRFDTPYSTQSGIWSGSNSIIYKTKRIGEYTCHNVNNGWFWCLEGPSLIDYFSGRRYDVLRTSHIHIAYGDDLDKVESLESVNVGGGTYPTDGRSMTVAAPVIYRNSFCYGSVGSSTGIYGLSTGKTDMGTQVQVAGHTFESLGDGTYYRLD